MKEVLGNEDVAAVASNLAAKERIEEPRVWNCTGSQICNLLPLWGGLVNQLGRTP